MKLNPANGQLWAAVQERDFIGDDLVPDFFTSVRSGGFLWLAVRLHRSA